MRIVFFSSDEISIPALEELLSRGIEISGIVTSPDRRAGRGMKLKPPAPKSFGEKYGIEVLQPEKIKKNREFLEKLSSLAADAFVVVSYGKILPPSVFNLPPKGTLNLHFSLLPALRGASPLRWAILLGMERTGATVFLIDRGLDTGPILSQMEFEIKEEENYGEAMERMAKETAPFLADTLIQWLKGEIEPKPQRGEVSYAPKIEKSSAALSLEEEAETLVRKIRAFNPDLKPWVPFRGGRLIILRARRAGGKGKPGEILAKQGESLLVATGKDAILLEKVQIPGKKPISGAAFANGTRLKPGHFLK